MWYVIQVRTGNEHSILTQCRKQISRDILTEAFLPCYEEKRKVGGVWILQKRLLFPGYVFLVSENIKALADGLHSIVGLTKLLGTGDEIVPLTEEETLFLLEFGGEEQLAELSEGLIIGEQIVILKGPLKGREGQIRKIDRHKRKAWLEIKMFGRRQQIQAGLEIVAKIKDEEQKL